VISLDQVRPLLVVVAPDFLLVEAGDRLEWMVLDRTSGVVSDHIRLFRR
jgi:hypothetical protein